MLGLTVAGVATEVAYLRRPGPRPTLLCLHGFGSTKEEYADLALHPAFAERDLVFYDAPGFGASSVETPGSLSIPFLVETALAVCSAFGLERWHLSGHSMGGLTALLLAHAQPDRVLSFVDIEGNVAPEDCFLSRQIVDHPADHAEQFLAAFVDRVAERPEYSSRLYASMIEHKVRASSVEPIFRSMVAISDGEPLMEMMAGLPMPRVFVHGEQNAHLSYLGGLPDLGVEVAEIPFAGHFPMYSNPTALWSVMADFIARAEAS